MRLSASRVACWYMCAARMLSRPILSIRSGVEVPGRFGGERVPRVPQILKTQMRHTDRSHSPSPTHRRVELTSPQGPAVDTTSVEGGTGSRIVGIPVSDHVVASGLEPNTVYRVTATLQDSAGEVCGAVTGTGKADAHGDLISDNSKIKACGHTSDTFLE
jgi:hypothetical protein